MTSPKQLLLNRLPDLEKWRTLFRSPDFEDIVTQAFADLHDSHDLTPEQGSAVRMFRGILVTILEPTQVPAEPKMRGLNYDLGQKPEPKKP